MNNCAKSVVTSGTPVPIIFANNFRYSKNTLIREENLKFCLFFQFSLFFFIFKRILLNLRLTGKKFIQSLSDFQVIVVKNPKLNNFSYDTTGTGYDTTGTGYDTTGTGYDTTGTVRA